MKKHITITAISCTLILCITLFSSCTKEEADLILGNWKITGAVFNPAVDLGLGPITDAMPLIQAQACDQDDFMTFEENGVFIQDEGATLCNPNDPQQETGTYDLDGTNLTMITGNDTINLTSVSITSSTLTASASMEVGLTNPVNVDFTMTKQ